MARYFIEVGYEGTSFCGFQIQDGQETVQSVVSAALQTVLKESIALTGSSRTDAGVHAKQNFFHFDTKLAVIGKHIYSMNAILPPTVVVHHIYLVASEAHARFDALSRTYTYTVTASAAATDRFTTSSTSGMVAGMSVRFTGTTFGGVFTDRKSVV